MKNNSSSNTPNSLTSFVSHKELAAKYGIHRDTLKKEVKKIKNLNLKKHQSLYSPIQLQKIFAELGNPFE